MQHQVAHGQSVKRTLQALVEQVGPHLRDNSLLRSVLERSLASLGGGVPLREAAESALASASITVVEDVATYSAPTAAEVQPPQPPGAADPVEIARQRLMRDRSVPQHRRQHLLLSAEEEVGLALIAKPDGKPLEVGGYGRLLGEPRAAAEALFLHNMRLAHFVAQTYAGQGLELDDLTQHAMSGLIRAIELFDPTMGNKFSTYAMYWLRQSVTRAIANESRAIRLPVHMWDLVRKVITTRDEFTVDGRRPRLAMVADQCGVTVEKVLECLRLAPAVVSLNTPLGDDQFTLGDLVDAQSQELEHVEIQGLYTEDVEDMLHFVTERQEEVLRMRYGIYPFEEKHTLEEIGKAYGVTRERIRQIEAKATKSIRDALADMGYQVPVDSPKNSGSETC